VDARVAAGVAAGHVGSHDKQTQEGGGFSIGKVLSAFLPSHAIPALVGAARALPDEVRHLTADVAGSAANLFDPAEYGHPTQQQECHLPVRLWRGSSKVTRRPARGGAPEPVAAQRHQHDPDSPADRQSSDCQ
jgi:hypothetical protein